MDTIDKINSSDEPFAFIQTLTPRKILPLLKIASDHYYNTSHPVMSDELYDMVVDRLKEIDPDNEWFHGIGYSVRGNKVKLPFWMGSLDKFKMGDNNFSNWLKIHKPPFLITDKLDGLSGLLYKKNGIVKLYTRGDGSYGKDISHLLPLMHINLNKLPDEEIAIRGELIISRDDFSKKYSKVMENARNMASGITNTKKDKLGKSVKDLRLVTYEIIYPTEIKPSKQLKLLAKYGMEVVYQKEVNSITMEKLDAYLTKRRKESLYDIDGIVIAEDIPHHRNTSGDPSYEFAYKGMTESAVVTVTDVVWGESADGYLNPRVKYTPVKLSGATLTYATGINAKFIVDHKIGKGAKIRVVRSNDTIPKILETIRPAKEPQLPVGIKYHWSKSGVYIVMDNPEKSSTVKVKRIMKFLHQMKMEYLGEGLVSRLVEYGYDTPLKILLLTTNDLMKIEGFKETLANKIISNLRKSINNLDTLTLMAGSNILGRGLGRKKLELILEKYPNFIDSYTPKDRQKWTDRLLSIPGFNDTTINKILDHMPEYQDFQKKISKKIKVKKYKSHINPNGKFAGMNIVFTGFRNSGWEDEIKNAGGKVSTSISKNTTLLVHSPNAVDTDKYNKAKDLGVKIVTMDEFQRKYL